MSSLFCPTRHEPSRYINEDLDYLINYVEQRKYKPLPCLAIARQTYRSGKICVVFFVVDFSLFCSVVGPTTGRRYIHWSGAYVAGACSYDELARHST